MVGGDLENMTVRRALNVVYQILVEPYRKDPDLLEYFNRRLNVKFDHEMTEAEKRFEEMRRNAEDTGAIKGERQLLGALGGMRVGPA